MASLPNASDGTVRRKYGNLLPSLNVGLVEIGEMMGTELPAATWEAVTEAPEQAAPMMTLTPCRPNDAC
eukprot:4464724-Prymnesium_polylepis.1